MKINLLLTEIILFSSLNIKTFERKSNGRVVNTSVRIQLDSMDEMSGPPGTHSKRIPGTVQVVHPRGGDPHLLPCRQGKQDHLVQYRVSVHLLHWVLVRVTACYLQMGIKGPFALGDNDVYFSVVMCEQLH